MVLTVMDFLIQFDIVATNNSWDSQEKGKRLCSALKKSAREVLSILGRRRAMNYRALVQELLKRHNPREQESKYSIQLMSKKYDKRTEDLPKFAQSL